ncbi:unnamed protein product [Darwinula stevensoni]|uniref:Uncharacterized protein n=1 Tax=Darwinula stevensoni TaxID=69355 RepID=A0A7R9AEG8_9CRUS|nr:unnamed protein product [Darwinula stevensoni]CAG0901975.1 unnamed protein product [Darwinula stevensoni]
MELFFPKRWNAMERNETEIFPGTERNKMNNCGTDHELEYLEIRWNGMEHGTKKKFRSGALTWKKKSKKLFINMKGIPCLLFALILSTKSGSGKALESTPIHGRENIVDSLEEMMLALRTTTLEHAKEISQLKSENERLWNDKESLRDDYKKMKYDFESMRKATGKLSTEYENLRKEHENLKSSFQEHLQENGELKLQLNTTRERLQYLEALSLQITPRTCQTLADLGVTWTGEYLVDPDGALIGDAPIKVLCDMETVSTIVLHDSMGNTAIDQCADPGCYNHTIRYGSSMKQMVALMKQSKSCDQQIRYDCSTTALTTGDIHYAWWVDRHGEPQYYWHGSNAGQHMCKCGLSGNCIDSNFPCNCDAKAPRWESDSGAITNETALPITELHFGGLQFKGQQANYTLGGLACKGKTPPPDNPAQSCSSLRQAGSTHPGYYLINSKKGRLDVVLCRMDLEEFDPKFQVETNARIAGGGFLHGKVTHPDNPAQSCSSLRRAGNAHSGYYLINSKKGRLDVVMCRMDLEDNNPEFQKETNARISREAIYFDVYGALGSNGSVVHYSGVDVNIGGAMNYTKWNDAQIASAKLGLCLEAH